MIVKIILKRLRGALQVEEEILFQHWLFANKNNIRTYYRLKEYISSNGSIPDITELDANEAWKKINATLDKKELNKQPIKPKRSLWRYAAVFVFILGGFLYFNNSNRLTDTVEKTTVNGITLEMGSGRIQTLSPQGTSSIVNTNGQVLGKKEGAVLDYTENEGIANNSSIEYNTITIPNGKKFQILLSDSTLVHLNSGSSLKFPTQFSKGKYREVTLSGEAFFDVHKDAESPFIVTSGSMAIRVLGTSFNVSAYPEDMHQSAVLVEGAVQLYEAGTPYEKEDATLLSSGFKAEWNTADKKPSLEKVDTTLYTAWKEGKLVMREVAFSAIIQRLQRHYGVKIKNDYRELDKRVFTATFEKETIEEVLETFKIETPFTYDINGDSVHIHHSTNNTKNAMPMKQKDDRGYPVTNQ
ncbi:FecR family protein [Flavimarina sp. Hel_I_48]|uniref:FecR family protein n=1 Tax=Flavimarina sp. Hel_I_48 TaxID=1392488 RepID=UPI0004DF8330|nr:FecR domain-containing protein [Flavimarina sp. Hel_I_48]